jgi:hypothetical protein
MTKRINSYQDLLDEKERLQVLLIAQKEILREDIREIKEDLAPVRSAISFASKLVTRDRHNWVLNAGASTVIDMVVKKLILSRAGWITRLVIPFLVKNYSSHVIADKKSTLLSKLFSWIGKKNANGSEETAEKETTEEE